MRRSRKREKKPMHTDPHNYPTQNYPTCGAHKDGYTCMLSKGHKGDHQGVKAVTVTWSANCTNRVALGAHDYTCMRQHGHGASHEWYSSDNTIILQWTDTAGYWD